VAQPDTTADVTWREVRLVLDEELNRLPEKYRAPLVLCYLEGMTQDEAAHQLGWPRGVLRGRLDRGRERLRARLVRRGLGLSAALLGVLAESAGTASVPAALSFTTVKAAPPFAAGRAAPGVVSAGVAVLAEEVIQAMIAMKLRMSALLLVALVVVGSVSGALGYRALAGERAGNAPQEPRPEAAAEADKAEPAEGGNAPKVIAALKDVGEVLEPEDTLELVQEQMQLLILKEAPVRMALSNTSVADYTILGPTQLSVVGGQPGSATWYVWFGDLKAADRGKILSLRVRVRSPNDGPVKEPPRSKRFDQYVQEIIQAKETITVQKGESRLILLKQPPKTIQIADPEIGNYDVAAAGQLVLKGLKPGTTGMTLWFFAEDDKGKEKVLPLLIRVTP
jgi:hypothetical protein